MSELNVKAGDKVIVRSQTDIDRIGIVDKVTPSGRIKVNGNTYRKDGTQITKDTWYSTYIVECSEENLKEVRQQIRQQLTIRKAINAMRFYPEEKMTHEKAVKILDLLEGKDGEASQ